MSAEVILDASRVTVCLAFFIYASISDIKKREVSNTVWLIMAPLAVSLTLFQFIMFYPQLLPFYALSFAITTTLSFLLFYIGAFGGADAKALMCLALALPTYPANLFQFNVRRMSPLFPLTVFSNAVLLAALTAVYAVLRNSFWTLKTGRKLFDGFENESVWKKLLAFLTGYKINVAQLEESYMLPLEDITSNEKGTDTRRLLLMPKDDERESITNRILRAKHEGKLQDEVWATPGLPLLVFITLGLIVSAAIGDLIWILLGLILA